MANAGEAFKNTLAGEAVSQFQAGVPHAAAARDAARAAQEARAAGQVAGLNQFADGAPNPYAGIPLDVLDRSAAAAGGEASARRQAYDASEASRQTELARMPSWTDAQGVAGKVVAGATALGGQMIGGLFSPENWIGAGGGEVAGAVNGARRLGDMFLSGAARNTPAAVIGDVASQAGQVSRGEREAFSPEQAAVSAALGGVLGGALHIAPELANGLVQRVRNLRAVHGASPAAVSAPVTQAELGAVFGDADVQTLAQANGITDPHDPRLAPLRAVLAARRGGEAQVAAAPPGAGMEAVRAADEAVADGAHPAAVSPAQREVPASFQVTPSGQAVPLDANGLMTPEARSINQGIMLRGDPRSTALVPVEPQARPMDAGEIARARAQMGAETPGPSESIVAHARAVLERGEGNPAANTQAPSRVYVRDESLVPWDRAGRPTDRRTAPAIGDGSAGQRNLPLGAAEAPPWLGGPLFGRPKDISEAPVPKASATRPDPRSSAAPGKATLESNAAPQGGVKPLMKRSAPEPAPPRAVGPGDGPWEAIRREATVRVARYQSDLAAVRERVDAARSAVARYRAEHGLVSQAALARRKASDPELQRLLADVANAGRAETAKNQALAAAQGRVAVAERAMHDLAEHREPAFRPAYPNPEANRPVALPAEPRAPQRILAAIRERGGIKETGGNLRAMELRTPGVVNNRSGLGLDQMARTLAHDGFLRLDPESGPERDMTGELLNLIRRDDSGQPVYRPEQAAEHAELTAEHSHALAQLDAIADGLGLTRDQMRGLSRGQLADMLSAQHSEAERLDMARSLDDAIEAELEAARHEHEAWSAEQGNMPEGYADSAAPLDATPDNPEYLDHGAGIAGHGEASGRSGHAGVSDAGEPEPSPGGAGQVAGGVGNGADRTGGARFPGEEGRPRADADSGQGTLDAGQGGESSQGRDPLRRAVEDNGQAVLPGAEASTKQALRSRAEAPLRGKGPQADMSKFDLFDPEARNQGKLFDEGAKGADDIQGKLYSGPGAIFDPDAWRFMFGPIKKHVLQPWAESFGEFVDAMRTDRAGKDATDARTPRARGAGTPLAARAENALPRPARQTAAMLRAVLYGDDSAMRAVADRLPEGSRAAMHDFLDLWHARAGEARGAGQTFHEGVNAQFSAMANKLSDILGETVKDKAAMAQLVRMVQNPRANRTGTPMGQKAAAIQGWLRDALKYQRDAGVDVGEIRAGYFPRRLDPLAVFRNEGGFMAAATKAFSAAGLNAREARASAEAWLSDIKSNGADKGPTVRMHDGLGGDHINGRTLPKSADETLREFMIQDPAHVLMSYAHAATRQAEFARVMGKDNAAWSKLHAALGKDGADAVLPRIADYVRTATGAVESKVSPRVQNALGWARLWGSMGLMDKSAITSATELFGATARTGRMLDSWTQARTMVAYWLGRESAERVTQLAEDIGTVVSHLAGSMAAARWVGDDMGGALRARTALRYFRAIGLEQWSHGMNVAATNVGDLFLRRMAGDVGKDARAGREARFSLAELGIPEAKQAAFAAWLKGATQNGKQGMDVATLRGAPADMATAYRTAVVRFTRQVHMQPTAATRPRWAGTPLGGVAFHLSSYAYAVHTNILMRAVRMMKDDNLTAADKLILGGKIAMGILMAVPAQMALGELRSAIFDSPQARKSYPERAAETAVSRSGVLGAIDPWYQLLSGMRYHRELSTLMAGPAGGRLLSAAQVGLNYVQGLDHTKGDDRKMAQALYDAGLKPMANLAGTAMPLPIAAAIAQWLGSGSQRETFVTNVAGPPARRVHHGGW